MTVMGLQATSLESVQHRKGSLLAGEKHELCFSQEELNKVLEVEERTQAREEAESSGKLSREPAMHRQEPGSERIFSVQWRQFKRRQRLRRIRIFCQLRLYHRDKMRYDIE